MKPKQKILNSLLLFCAALILTTGILAQSKVSKVTGKITDEKGSPLPMVTVIVKNTTVGAASDIDGNYEISIPDNTPNPVLVYTFIGFFPVEETVGNRTSINVKLIENLRELDEVVVTALGIKRKEKALGYSVQNVNGNAVNVAKGVNVATSLTGKVAGLMIQNTNEISETPQIFLRGEKPLVVIDGVPYENVTLGDISADDIENIDVLKGATASALYGIKGRNGALMISTKKGKDQTLSINVSNNTMFRAGFLKMPESQSSYSSGDYGQLEYGSGYVWGAYMDGREVKHYDPISKQEKVYPLYSVGKDNLKNFLESGFITNTNVNISQSGELGSFRVSATQVHQKGQWPGTKLDKYIVNAGGTIKYNKFSLDAGLSFKREDSPNMPIVNYGGSNYLYNMLIWTGKEINVQDYKDYWKVKDQEQNWPWTGWYDNPYFLANERKEKRGNNLFNGQVTLNYDIVKGLKVIFRSGFDNYSNETEWRRSMGDSGSKQGYYSIQEETGWSSNNDFIINGEKKVGDFNFDILGGASYSYRKEQKFWGETKGGLSIPGFYSLNASKEPAGVFKEYKEKAVSSLYGKFSTSWKDGVYVDITGRNDWASTLSKNERSYFYPSIALSFLPTQFYNPLPKIIDYWKLRTSWTVSKSDPDIFDINEVYEIQQDVWDGKTTANFPEMIRGVSMEPQTERSFEIGTDFRFLKNRIGLDITYFNRLRYNRIEKAYVSKGSGLNQAYVNIAEDHVQKGMEFTMTATPIDKKDFKWNTLFNISYWRWYFDSFDPNFSANDPRITIGSRKDMYYTRDWTRDADGNIVHQGGVPVLNDYESIVGYKDPDFIAGWVNKFTFKDFSLTLSIDGRFGGKMFSWTEQAMWHSGAHPDSDNQWRYDEVVNGKKNYIGQGVKIVSGELKHDLYGRVIEDTRVFAPNDVAVSYEGYITTYNNNAWDHFAPQNFIDPTFVKLREMSLNYTLPQKFSGKLGVKKMEVGIVGQNLLIWTKEARFSDPDRRQKDTGNENLNSPSERYIGFNINISL